MTDAIVFDIDGTLSNLEHRRHHVSSGYGRPNWSRFFEEMVHDQPVEDVCWLAEMLAEHCHDPALFIFTGRPEEYREQTESWLRYAVPELMHETMAVMMRSEGDYRPDTVVKKEMLEGVRGQGFDVRIVIDDRQSVVDMWRAEGVTCLQAAASDWEGKKSWPPGKLIMMIGPACSGKSTWARNRVANGHCTADAVIATDNFREQIYGNVRRWDAKRQPQVHGAALAQAVARIEYGLDVVYDATNLRDRDRRKIRDAMPADVEIEYLVMDRPLDVKLRDAGWREGVEINGEPLIERHHRIMQANLKNILAGDGDPRVHVEDMRILT